jgi:hypothetical protein
MTPPLRQELIPGDFPACLLQRVGWLPDGLELGPVVRWLVVDILIVVEDRMHCIIRVGGAQEQCKVS